MQFKLTQGLILAIIALVAANAAATSTTGGVAYIHCLVAVPDFEAPCDPELRGADVVTQATGTVASAILELTWAANSADAATLTLALFGNTACHEDPSAPTNCNRSRVTGSSPLRAVLYGAAASGVRLVGVIELSSVCASDEDPFTDCPIPPVKLVRDQPFTYEWIVNE